MLRFFIGLQCLLAFTLHAAVTFTQAPTVVLQGTGYQILFGVSVSTDVEVAILDVQGKIVRHLAAGVIGQGTPPVPLAAGLSQSLTWDGKDDSGNAAAGGPFSVRVRLGLKPEFDHSISTLEIPGTHYPSPVMARGEFPGHDLVIPVINRSCAKPD